MGVSGLAVALRSGLGLETPKLDEAAEVIDPVEFGEAPERWSTEVEDEFLDDIEVKAP